MPAPTTTTLFAMQDWDHAEVAHAHKMLNQRAMVNAFPKASERMVYLVFLSQLHRRYAVCELMRS